MREATVKKIETNAAATAAEALREHRVRIAEAETLHGDQLADLQRCAADIVRGEEVQRRIRDLENELSALRGRAYLSENVDDAIAAVEKELLQFRNSDALVKASAAESAKPVLEQHTRQAWEVLLALRAEEKSLKYELLRDEAAELRERLRIEGAALVKTFADIRGLEAVAAELGKRALFELPREFEEVLKPLLAAPRHIEVAPAAAAIKARLNI